MTILEGLLFGIGTILFVGPVFFTLLQISIDNGRYAGIAVAFGIILSDIVIIALLLLGINEWIENLSVQFWLAAIGSLVLISLGLKNILRPSESIQSSEFPTIVQNAGAFVKGFLVNFVNPFVFFIWISILAYSEKSFDSDLDVQLFLFGVLLGIFSTDVLKAIFADRLKRLLSPQLLRRIQIIIGLVLIGFGVRLLFFIAMET